MKVLWYIDPNDEPWRITEEGVADGPTVAMDVPLRNVTGEGEDYSLMLRFARKGHSNRFYLVGIIRSEWDNPDLDRIARSC